MKKRFQRVSREISLGEIQFRDCDEKKVPRDVMRN